MPEGKSDKKFRIYFGKSSLILIAVFAVLLTADLVLKTVAKEYCWEFTVIPGLIEVVPMQYNSGAAFSFLSNKDWAQAFFIILTFIMLAALIFGFLCLPKKFVVLRVAITLLCAGAVGNLVDRLIWGSVRDFVDVWMFGGMACCNFADFWITFGVALAIVDMLFLNEWAIIPLTKSAKAAQRKENNVSESSPEVIASSESAPEDGVTSTVSNGESVADAANAVPAEGQTSAEIPVETGRADGEEGEK